MIAPTLIDYVRYRDYEELVAALRTLQSEFPDLIELEVIGESYEGRDIYGVTLTDTSAGPADEKPALYVDCNIHAGEVTTAAFALYLMGYLAENHDESPLVQKLLADHTLYLIPRIAVDGADVYIKTAYNIRSSKNELKDYDSETGIDLQDLNGDGAVTLMRVPHPHGEWKASEKDPRVMVHRAPGELIGDFYKIYPEGRLRRPDELDPVTVRTWGDGYPRWPLDLNRHFPKGWSPTQEGASDIPISEPETKAQVGFILDHPNIASMVVFHTAAGMILGPVPKAPAEGFPEADLHVFARLTERAEQHTGYPALQAHDFMSDISGNFLDWSYHHLGYVCFLIEMWNIADAAGVEIPPDLFGKFYVNIPEDAEIQMLQWLDREFDGEGFSDWAHFDHPELGPVEIGGWQLKFTRQNPPLPYLEEELKRNLPFVLEMMGALPRVSFGKTRITPLGDDAVRVQVQVQNAGYLPTHVTQQALDAGKAEPVRVTFDTTLGEVIGHCERDMGHLDGRSTHGDQQGRIGYNIYGNPVAEFERVAEWTVRLQDGKFEGEICAGTPRAGRTQMSICWPE